MPQVGIIRNVVIFGETGAGKSSVVNMILGSNEAKTSGDAGGCTFDSTVYSVEIRRRLYNLHDTVGLGDHSNGRLVTKAIGNLYNLLTTLSKNGGVHLLIFVVRCGRLTETIHKNYALFYQGLCDAQVPIAIVVTGCEDVEPQMEMWWGRNEVFFTKAGMSFMGHACICAFKGRETAYGFANEDLVEDSKGLVDDLIVTCCGSEGWKKEPNDWFHAISTFLGLFRPPKITHNVFPPPNGTQWGPPSPELDDDAGKAQVDGEFASNQGNAFPSNGQDKIISSTMTPVRADVATTSPSSRSSIEIQNARDIRASTSLSPSPKHDGISSSTIAPRVELFGRPITPPAVRSVELQNAWQGSSTQNKSGEVANEQPVVPFSVSGIGPQNRHLAMSYTSPPPASKARVTYGLQTILPRDPVTPNSDPLNIREILIPAPSPSMPGAFIFSPKAAPASLLPEPLHVPQNVSNEAPTPPPKSLSNSTSTISSSDVPSVIPVSCVDQYWQKVHQNWSDSLPPPPSQKAQGIFNPTVIQTRDRLSTSSSVRSAFPWDRRQNSSNESWLHNLKEPNIVDPIYIPFKTETLDPVVPFSSLEPQNLYQSQSNYRTSLPSSSQTGQIDTAVRNLDEVKTEIGPSSTTKTGSIANSKAETVVKAPFRSAQRSFPTWRRPSRGDQLG